MAFCIEVIKDDQEDKNFIYYTYQFSLPAYKYKTTSNKIRYKLKIVSGKLKINKRNGNVQILEFAEEDNGVYAQRASWVLMKHWKQGEFPDKAYWVS
jgi:hypothetical protein